MSTPPQGPRDEPWAFPAGQQPHPPQPAAPEPYSPQPYSPQPYPQGSGQPYPQAAGQPYPQAGQPYPQQPSSQQQPWQPGAALPPPPGAVPGDAPAATPRSPLPRILIAVLVVVAVGLGVFLYLQNKQTDTASADVGDCLKVEGTTTIGQPKSEQVPCTDPAAAFVVTETGDSSVSCDDAELSFEQYSSDDQSDVRTRLCLRPNFTVGKCYVEGATSVDLPQVGDCSTVEGTLKVKVLSIDTSTGSTAKCPDPELAYGYPKRNLAVCFAKP